MNNISLVTLGVVSLILSFGLYSHQMDAHEHHEKPELSAKKATTNTGKIVSGGYQYTPGLLTPPPEVDLQHAHGLTRDNEDNIYLAYTSNTIDKNTRAIIMFNKQGEFVRYIGDASLAIGDPHGLDLTYENNSKYLYLSSNDGSVRKLTTEGKIIWHSSQAPNINIYKNKSYKPTDTAAHPSSDQLFVADGYGNNKVIELNKKNGNFTNKKVWSGESTGKVFSTPHGITFDTRKNKIAVADRENHRIVYFDKKGNLLNTMKGQGISRIVNSDIWNDYLLVSNLDGMVSYFNKKDKLMGIIKLNEVLGNKNHKHPHDAIFMSNGDIVIATWNPGRLSYWKRMYD